MKQKHIRVKVLLVLIDSHRYECMTISARKLARSVIRRGPLLKLGPDLDNGSGIGLILRMESFNTYLGSPDLSL